MTWLSRILAQNMSTRHRAPSSRDPKGLRRRMILEYLEGRVVLSNVIVNTYFAPTGALTILGDAGNDGIQITENSATAAIHPGAVTVAPLTPQTFINGFTSAYNSVSPVSSIAVSFGAGTANNVEKIVLLGAGKTVPTAVKNINITLGSQFLGLAVGGGVAGANGVDNNGAFNVTTSGNINGPGTNTAALASPTFTGGAATVDASTFQSLSILQTPPSDLCNAQVELGGDAIAGSVSVVEASGAADKITVGPFAGLATPNSVLGATTLTQGDGAGDTVLADPNCASLSITQGNGAGDMITVNPLVITSPISFGLKTVQGNGVGDTTTISHVTLSAQALSINLPSSTTSLASISVTQGNGNSDTASVSTSTIQGNITITQGNGNTDTASAISDTLLTNPFVVGGITITQGNATIGTGNNDTALVMNSTLPGAVTINQQGNGNNDSATVDPTTAASVTINQGNGATNSATVSSDTIGNGGVSITQGNGNNDTATVSSDTVGTGGITILQGAGNTDTALVMNTTTTGNVSITQGDGNNDSATVDPTTIGGNLTISQGNGNTDTATVTNTTVTGNITITQQNGNGDVVIVTGTVAGSSTGGGELTISQGDGYGDTVTLDSTTVDDVFNDVNITQGNDVAPPGTPQGPVLSDLISLQDMVTARGVQTTQGTILSKGSYIMLTATTSAVLVGTTTSAKQNGIGDIVSPRWAPVLRAWLRTSPPPGWTSSPVLAGKPSSRPRTRSS